MSMAELFYDIDSAMGVIEQVGPGAYFDMIGGAGNAAWLDQDFMDEDMIYDMYGSDDDDDSYDNENMETKTFLTLQDSSVLQRLSFRSDNKTSLPKTHPVKVKCYEDLYRLLEEVELMVRTWRKRCDHAYTAHLRADPQAAASENYDQLRMGEDYGFSDYEIEDDDSDCGHLSGTSAPVPNENLTRKKFCQSVKVFHKIFPSDPQFDAFQRNIFKIKKYIFRTVFQNFLNTLPTEIGTKLPQELWEKIWKYTQNGYFRVKGSEPLHADKSYYKAGQRVNETTHPHLWKVEQSRIMELFGAVGNLHMTMFEILFQSVPSRAQNFDSVDDWELNNLATDSASNYNESWTVHSALLRQKFARLTQLDTYLAAQETGDVRALVDLPGEECKPTLNLFQRAERGLFSVQETPMKGNLKKQDKSSELDFFSNQMCKYFGSIGYKESVKEEPTLLLDICDARKSGQVRFSVNTSLNYSLFKIELAKFAPRRVGQTNWRKSLCLTDDRVTVIYSDMMVTSMTLHLKVWSTSLTGDNLTKAPSTTALTTASSSTASSSTASSTTALTTASSSTPSSSTASSSTASSTTASATTVKTESINLTEALVDEVVAEGDEELVEDPADGAINIPNKKSKKKEADSLDVKRRELSKRDIQPTVFHSSDRVVVCLQNPFKAKETLLNVYSAQSGEKYLELSWPDEDLSLVGFKDNLAMMINRTHSQIQVLNTECGEPVLKLAISDLNKDATSYGPWVGLFDCVPGVHEFVLLRSDNSEYRLYSYDPATEMSVPVLKESSQLADKAVFCSDSLTCAKLKDGVLYYNRRSTHQCVNLDMERLEEVHHELACYNLRSLTYAPILLMLPNTRNLMVTKFNEHSSQFTDTCTPKKSFDKSRPLLVVDDLRLAHVNEPKDGVKIKLLDFDKDELEVIGDEINVETARVEEEAKVEAKRVEEINRELDRMVVYETKMLEEREIARQNILDKDVRVEGVVVDYRGTFGFLRTREEGKALGRIFFHRRNVKGHEESKFKPGVSFTYTITTGRDPGSYQAQNVKLLAMEDRVVRLSENNNPDPIDVEIVIQTSHVSKIDAIKTLRQCKFDLVAALSQTRPLHLSNWKLKAHQ